MFTNCIIYFFSRRQSYRKYILKSYKHMYIYIYKTIIVENGHGEIKT